MMCVRETAFAAHAAGICVLPPREDGSKAPDADSWKMYQDQRPPHHRIEAWYGNGTRSGLGVVCGAVSGGLELLDFDDRASYEALKALAAETGLGSLVERIEAGYCEATPGGGFHWLYRCETIGGNAKLAARPKRADERRDEHDRVKTLIETRGEGGYVVVAPSNGRVHPSGGAYRLLRGDVATIATITSEERADLIAAARALDAIPRPERPDDRQATPSGGKPGDDYNGRGDVLALLQAHGWRVVSNRGGITYLRRPGKDRGISATFGHAGTRYFYCFSTSTEFESERAYSPFAVYSLLEHNGDFAAAARALSEQGYGEPASSPHERDPVRPQADTNVSAGTPSGGAAERKFAFRSAREIAAATTEAPPFIAEPWVAAGALTEIDGKIKSAGKTTFCTHMCRAILDGHDFMGNPTQRSPVVYLSEQSAATFREALRRADLLAREDFRVLLWHDTIGAKWPDVVVPRGPKRPASGRESWSWTRSASSQACAVMPRTMPARPSKPWPPCKRLPPSMAWRSSSCATSGRAAGR